MSRVLSFKLLGPFQVERPQGLKLLTRKVEALAAYLALSPGRLRHRGELAELLWGSRDEELARHSLRQALSSIRRSLTKADIDALVTEGDRVGFRSDAVTTDVAQLDTALRDGSPLSLSTLSDLWRGDLLAGMDIREETFEEWLLRERTALRERMLSGLLRLLDQQCQDDPSGPAMNTARMVLRLDPTHEATHRRLMRLHAACNQRDLALRQYRDCAAVLRREFDVAPSAETRRLYEQLLGESGAPAPTPAPKSAAAAVPSTARRTSEPPVIILRSVSPATNDATESTIAALLNEDLLAAMSRDRSLRVIEPVAAAVADAAPAYVLAGTVRRIGDQARVTTHLTDAGGTTRLWSEQSDLARDRILNFDRNLASQLTAIFRREIQSAEARKALTGNAASLDPWGWYHLGLREMYRFTMPGLRSARDYFRRAISLDPEIAAAHARLAYVFLQMYWYGPDEEREQQLTLGLAAARQAVGLDPKIAHGHLALGRLYAIKGEFDLAIRALETAIALDGTFAQAHFGLGQAHAAAGDPGGALAPLDRAIALDPQDPHSWTFHHDRAEACFALGRLQEAERSSRIAVGLPNASHFAHATLVAVNGAAGNRDGATAAIAQLRQINPGYTLGVAAEELRHHANQSFVGEYLGGLQQAGLAA